MVYDDETLQVKRDQQKLKNKNVNMQGFEERLKGLVFQCDSRQYLQRVKNAIRRQFGGIYQPLVWQQSVIPREFAGSVILMNFKVLNIGYFINNISFIFIFKNEIILAPKLSMK